MRRLCVFAGVFAAFSFGICRVEAQYPYPAMRGNANYHSHWVDIWHRNNRWPEPFVSQDRAAVRAPFAVMIDKGWQLENTLGDHHFDVETQQLTRAGEIHLRWIVTKNAENRRTVFVLRGHNDAATTVRIDTVQQAVASIQPRGSLPEVVQTTIAPPSSPAERTDDIQTKAIKARPAPVLPAASSSGSGGSSSGM